MKVVVCCPRVVADYKRLFAGLPGAVRCDIKHENPISIFPENSRHIGSSDYYTNKVLVVVESDALQYSWMYKEGD